MAANTRYNDIGREFCIMTAIVGFWGCVEGLGYALRVADVPFGDCEVGVKGGLGYFATEKEVLELGGRTRY